MTKSNISQMLVLALLVNMISAVSFFALPNIASAAIVASNLAFDLDLTQSGSIVQKIGATGDITGITETDTTITSLALPGGTRNVRSFNGSSSYIKIPANTTLNLASYSMEAWVYSKSNPGWIPTLFSKNNATNTGVYRSVTMWPWWADLMQVQENENWALNSSGINNDINIWTHYVVTFDSIATTHNVKCYKNGILIGDSTSNSMYDSVKNAGGDMYIGKSPFLDNGRSIDGYVGEFRLYSVPLTQAEVTTNYNAATPTYIGAPPTISSVSPNLSTAVSTSNTNITVTFDKTMDQTTLNETNIILKKGGVAVTGYTPTVTDTTYSIPVTLEGYKDYSLTVTTNVKDSSSTALLIQKVYNFKTELANAVYYDAAIYKPVTITSGTPYNASQNNVNASITDNNLTTFWQWNWASNNAFYVDLGAAYQINKLNLVGSTTAAHTENISIYGSNDATFTSKTLLSTIAPGSQTLVNGQNTFNSVVTDSNKYRYIQAIQTSANNTTISNFNVLTLKRTEIAGSTYKDVALNKPSVTTNYANTTTGVAGNVNDGDTSTAYYSGWANNPTWDVDLGAQYSIDKLTIKDMYANAPQHIENIKIYGSNDSNYATKYLLATVESGSVSLDDGTWSSMVTDGIKYRYLRLIKPGDGEIFITDFKALVINPVVSEFAIKNSVDGTGDTITTLTAGTAAGGKAIITNNSQQPIPVSFIVALYNGDKLVGIKIDSSNQIIDAGATLTLKDGFEGSTIMTGYTLKAFLFKDINSITPYVPNIKTN